MRTARIFLQRYPVITYFVLVLLISYGSFLVVVGPKLLRGGTEQASDAEFILFPILDMGVLLTALVLTGVLDGRSGLRKLFARMGRWRVSPLWYAVAILTPPVLALAVLLGFSALVSPAFTPKLFLIGILFGIPGIIEEIGWTGYAFPRMQADEARWPPRSCLVCCGDCGMRLWLIISEPPPHTEPTGCPSFSPSSP